MIALKILAIPTADATRVRSAMHDDYGNALAPLISDGSGPCRHCLRYAKSGERLLLLSYRPFAKPGPYQEVGPVFVHADGCERHATDGFPAEFVERPLVLRPYDADDNIQDSQVFADAGSAERAAQALLENPKVAYVHARSRTRGCYMFRIERASGPAV
jgi:hypothetical protein